jgi:hypothetical protein
MRFLLKLGDKRAISEVIAYVLLISVAIGLSLMVYNFLVHYIPSEEVDSCPEGVTLSLRDVYCDATGDENYLTFEVKNTGLFGVDGFRVRVNDREGSRIGVHILGQEVYQDNRFNPGESKFFSVDYKSFVSSAQMKSDLKLLEVQPIYTVDGKPTFCRSVISELDCYPVFDITKFNGLVAYYPLSSDAKDYSGNGNDGVVYGNVLFEGGAAVFDGSNHHITFSHSPALDSQAFTISSWVNFNNLNQNGFIFEKGSVNTQYSFFSEGTNIIFRTKPSGDYHSQTVAKSTLGITEVGRWYYLVATYDGVDKKIFVDGVEKSSVYWGQVVSTNSWGQRIGAYGGNSPSYYFNGSISDVAIFDRVLSEREIKQIYNAGRIV